MTGIPKKADCPSANRYVENLSSKELQANGIWLFDSHGGFFSAALLLYAGCMALTKDYANLPIRARVSVQPKNPKQYMMQFAKVTALVATAPAIGGLIGLWNAFAGMLAMLISIIVFIWLGTKLMKNVE